MSKSDRIPPESRGTRILCLCDKFVAKFTVSTSGACSSSFKRKEQVLIRLFLFVWCMCVMSVHAFELPPGYVYDHEVAIPGYGKRVVYRHPETKMVKVELVAEKTSFARTSVGGSANAIAKSSFSNPPLQQKNLQRPSFATLLAERERNRGKFAPHPEIQPRQEIAKVVPPRVEPSVPAHVYGNDSEAYIMALNIYHESASLRGKNDIGWRSVAGVVFNRLGDPRFPKTIEAVIKEVQGGVCAFSWRCDHISDRPRHQALFEEILAESKKYLREYREGRWVDPVQGAHSYHANTVSPNQYFRGLKHVTTVAQGNLAHLFYKDKRLS